MFLNLVSDHSFYLVITEFLQFFKHFNLKLQILDLFVFCFDLLKQFYLLKLHEIHFFDVMRKPALVLVKLNFLLVLTNFFIHFLELCFYLSHMNFIWYYKFCLLSFEQCVNFGLKIISKGSKLLNRLWDGLGIFLWYCIEILLWMFCRSCRLAEVWFIFCFDSFEQKG